MKSLKNYLQLICLIALLLIFYGCQTANQNTRKNNESTKDIQTAIESVTEAIIGKDISKEELRDLSRQIEKDEEAKKAVESITGSIVSDQATVKYCPITGTRYAPHLQLCPEHGVELKEVEP